MINHGLGDKLDVINTDTTLMASEEGQGEETGGVETKTKPVEWKTYTPSDEEYSVGYRLILKHFKVLMNVYNYCFI